MAGLPADTIAAAFLLPPATMAQRLVRAKRHLRVRGVRFEFNPDEYAVRLPPVLAVLYLIYNEGYQAPDRRDLAREALDLTRQLTGLMPAEPEVAGLAALLELHEARAAARFDPAGGLVLLEDQDRSTWDRPLIRAAVGRLARAAAHDRPGPYQLEAAIAAQHALAPAYDRTDWPTVRVLYDHLRVLRPSPVVLLGRAVATGFVDGPATALAEVDALADRLTGYRLWHATRADLLRRLGRPTESVEATRRAWPWPPTRPSVNFSPAGWPPWALALHDRPHLDQITKRDPRPPGRHRHGVVDVIGHQVDEPTHHFLDLQVGPVRHGRPPVASRRHRLGRTGRLQLGPTRDDLPAACHLSHQELTSSSSPLAAAAPNQFASSPAMIMT